MSNYIFFDVGANNGCSFLHYLEKNPDMRIFAFEPNPQMVSVINEKVKKLKTLKYFKLFNVAVSDYTGKSKFNISGEEYSYGSSSLLELSDKAYTHWHGRTDMFVTETIEVDVITLESVISEYNIPRIDFLHIDTQGCDLNVLRGLGKYISIVERGIMEAAAQQDILYKNQNSLEDSINFLESNNFEIINVSTNDFVDSPNEVNIEFKRK